MTASEYTIEPVSTRHGQSLAALFRALRKAGDDRAFHPHPLDDTTAYAIAARRDRDVYAVVCDGGTVVGYGLLRGWESGFDVPSLGIAIHPAHRRRGIARTFMGWLHEVAQSRGATRIRLKVYPTNEVALQLYQELGYEFGGALEHGQLVGVLGLDGRLRRVSCA